MFISLKHVVRCSYFKNKRLKVLSFESIKNSNIKHNTR